MNEDLTNGLAAWKVALCIMALFFYFIAVIAPFNVSEKIRNYNKKRS